MNPSSNPGQTSEPAGDALPTPTSPRDAAFWAGPVTTLRVGELPAGAVNLNVTGRRVVGPLQGFGQLWQKTYQISLRGSVVTPVEVIQTWKAEFPKFWPAGNRFYGPLTGIAPGEVAVLKLKVGGMPLSTGVLVLYADDESFTLMTPQGHVFAGWITFSAYAGEPGKPGSAQPPADAAQPAVAPIQEGQIEQDTQTAASSPSESWTVAQAQVLMRANDPIYEMGLRFGGHRKEDLFWEHTLRALAAQFGVEAPVKMEMVCLDPRRQWAQAGNIWQNAAMRTMLYTLAAPIRWLRRRGTA